MNKLSYFSSKQRNKKRVCNIYFWPTCKVVKLKWGDVTLSTSLLMFHLISFSTNLFIMFHFISFSPQSISFISSTIVHLVHIYLSWLHHITWSFNLIVSFTFQPIPSLEINDLRVSLDKFLILDRYSLLEAELWWFYYSLSLYFKHEIKLLGNFVSKFWRLSKFWYAVLLIFLQYLKPLVNVSSFLFHLIHSSLLAYYSVLPVRGLSVLGSWVFFSSSVADSFIRLILLWLNLQRRSWN